MHWNIHWNSLFQLHVRVQLQPLAIVWEMVIVQVVPHGTYLEKGGNCSFSWKPGKHVFPGLPIISTLDDVIRE